MYDSKNDFYWENEKILDTPTANKRNDSEHNTLYVYNEQDAVNVLVIIYIKKTKKKIKSECPFVTFGQSLFFIIFVIKMMRPFVKGFDKEIPWSTHSEHWTLGWFIFFKSAKSQCQKSVPRSLPIRQKQALDSATISYNNDNMMSSIVCTWVHFKHS